MSIAPPYCGRFAPSPTGPLHPGSLLAALGSWLMARRAGGRWLVRIEDLDPPREVPGAARAQLRTLAACGLHPDGTVEYQSSHGARYGAALARLLESGAAFECHCSRADIAAHGGIAICSPIAPFDATRRHVRQLVESRGGRFLLVHVATPLEEREASEQLDQSRINYLLAVHDYLVARSAFETAVGLPMEADAAVRLTSRDEAPDEF